MKKIHYARRLKTCANRSISDYISCAAKLTTCFCHKGIHFGSIHNHGWNVKDLSSFQTKQWFWSVRNLARVTMLVMSTESKFNWYSIFQVRCNRFTKKQQRWEKTTQSKQSVLYPCDGGSLQLVFGFLSVCFFFLPDFPCLWLKNQVIFTYDR